MVFIFWNSRSLRMYTTVPALACVSVQSLVWILDNDCAKKAPKSGSARVNGHWHGKGRGVEGMEEGVDGCICKQAAAVVGYTTLRLRKRRRRGRGGNAHGKQGTYTLGWGGMAGRLRRSIVSNTYLVDRRGNHYYQCPHFRGVEIDILG